MKKTLIALAAVAVAGTAFAQNVTISGTLDVQAVNNSKSTTIADTKGVADKVDTKTAAPGNNGWATSELRFSGSEDLGGGLTASFQLNTGLGNGNQTLANRDRFLNLSGGFGSVRIGNFTPATDGSAAFGGHGTTLTAGSADTITNAGHGRQVAMQYTTPNMSGFTASVVYSSGKVDKAGAEGKGGKDLSGLAFNYAQGPLRVGAGTSKLTTNVEAAAGKAGFCVTAATTSPLSASSAASSCTGAAVGHTQDVSASKTKNTQNYLGASYDLGVATVSASHLTGKISKAGVNSADIKLNTLGVTVPVGAITLTASMYRGKDKVSSATDDDYNLRGHQVTARYALSKRTFVYAAMGENDRKRTGGNTEKGAANKTKQTTMGLVHSF